MIIDLSDIIKNVDEKITIDDELKFENISFMGDEFGFDKPLHIEGTITNNSKSLDLKGKVSGEMNVLCARCRKELTVPVKFRLNETIMQSGASDIAEDVIVIDDEKIDLADTVLNNFFMNVEGKYLCKDDCKGLCPKCGADLNFGDCGCDNDDIDPRWAKLAEIMKDSSDTK